MQRKSKKERTIKRKGNKIRKGVYLKEKLIKQEASRNEEQKLRNEKKEKGRNGLKIKQC